jgi:hypothetical protein
LHELKARHDSFRDLVQIAGTTLAVLRVPASASAQA